MPFPPTLNLYRRYRVNYSKKSRKPFVQSYQTQEAKNFRGYVFEKAFGKKVKGRCSVEIDLYPPDRRKRDIDNYTKVLLDSLTEAKIWHDDECIDVLLVKKMPPVKKGGYCMVRIIEN